MLKRLIKFLSPNGTPRAARRAPHVIPSGSHPLTPDHISSGARNVVDVLKGQGYQAYVVGGCVRDALLGLHPKDFDVATDATPEQVTALFRRSRIIGRRFRIVHVHMGREVIEVTTFRAGHGDGNHKDAVQSDQGMLLRDNVFGNIDEDARRRDFTANALYYDPQANTLYDYANGVRDIESRTLVVIGDPETRYREDPVRMLRAARFAAKLGFSISPESAAPIVPLSGLIADVPPARLFDEVLKLFLSGHALATFRQLQDYQLSAQLFPQTAEILARDSSGFYLDFIEQALTNTDKRIRTNQRVTPAFLFAALLWPAVNHMRAEFEARGETPAMAIQKAGGLVVARQVNRIAIPRRFSQPMREIWDLQQRLPNRTGTRAGHLVSLPRFRAAYDFVLLREQAGEDLNGLGHWWTRYQDADESGRRKLVEALGREPAAKRKRRRRAPRKPRPPTES
ncbi:MAG: polynucleotide adenylyltransferase PcnB [Porticoccaceae bacterium]